VKRLPKPSGCREHRWSHLLCDEGPPRADEKAVFPGSTDEPAELGERVARLELEVAELRAALKDLVAATRSPH
jgi:uncharacterized protein YceH (UPF0502 family)